MSPNFLKCCSNALKIAIFVGYSVHTYSPGQKEGSYGKVKTLCLYIVYHVFLFSEGFRAPAWHEGTSINFVHRAQGFEDVCE